ncbi:OB fold-containing protein, nucleic acid binding [Planoprotostelium fungivorum]|uniref:OB fold-containing protein, nucleic acid binding n=1 Tax=Planoprotostelium fungivorum TaxID=1890364 RepID=A0A2P6N5N4_9EUKA|nr:OB fold-containing protein, nucleic acid binding [Planoprotostelium fungivorum]
MQNAPLQYCKIGDLKPFQKCVNTIFIILEKGEITKTKDGSVMQKAQVADETASISITLWDNIGDSLQPGDICRLRNGYCTPYKNYLSLYVGRAGSLTRIGEFTMLFVEQPNMSLIVFSDAELNPKNSQKVLPGQQQPMNAH